MTRPDIACVVHAMARFYPELAHKKAFSKVVYHLLHRNEWGITYGEQDCEISMEASTDSDLFWSLPG